MDMERSNALINVVIIFVFLAMLAYGAASFLGNRSEQLQTVTALPMELRESVESAGWCVREETLVVSPLGGASLRVAEGEKVSSGAQLALTYDSGSDLSRAEEIRELSLELAQLEELSAGRKGASSAEESVILLADAVSRHELSNLDAIALDVQAYVFGTLSQEADYAAQIETLRQRIDNLRIASGGTSAVYSPCAGTFSASVDGFTAVSPADIAGKLTPSAATALFRQPSPVPTGAFGKVVSGFTWYYVTILPYRDASRLLGKNSITVNFSRSYAASLSMKVVSVGPEEDGKAVVVLSSDRAIAEVAALREMTAELVFSASSGIRVPREAVHLVNGQTVVYILKGLQASETPVTIDGEEGDYYMVTGGAEGLREGMEIIIRAANLQDEAVVRG